LGNAHPQNFITEETLICINLVVFIDDGWTGTNFERPSFKRMISDIEDGKIGIVLCKDLSRLGRNNALVAFYTELVFPDNDVRFIAVNDAIDTAMGDSGGNAVMPFMSVVNEYYARDISKKVKSAKRARALNGEHCARPPFGYLKDPNDNHKLIVEEETAAIVKRIFQMSLDGISHVKTAWMLAKEKVKCPTAYAFERTGKTYGCYDPTFPWNWNARTIKDILTNPLYLGHLVSHRQAKKSFKSKKVIYVPKEDWIIVEGTHTAIISQEVFDKVQVIEKTKFRPTASNFDNIYAGLLKCYDCGRCLTINHTSRKSKNTYFSCGGYRHGMRSAKESRCGPHSISVDNLEAMLKLYINKAINATLDVDEFVKSVLQSDTENSVDKKLLDKFRKRDIELKILIKKVFEQNALEKIDDDTFSELYNSYQFEQKEISLKIIELETKANRSKDTEANARLFAEAVSKYTEVETLTRDILLDLIEKVVVHEHTGQVRGPGRLQEVEIYFRFIGKLE